MAKNLLLTCNFCIMCEPNSVFVSQQNLEKKDCGNSPGDILQSE